MPYNGSGSFSPPSASFPAVPGALIESAKFNSIVNDIASGLSNAITKDGQTTVAANLNMAGFRHTNVGDAVTRTDYTSAKQAQDGSMLWAGTAGGTANAITLALTPALTAYSAGQSFIYKSGASANTSTMTVNINGLGAKAIQKNGSALTSGDHAASKLFRVTYDGAAFQLEQIVFGLPGTSTNDNAATGYIGEYVESKIGAGSSIAVVNDTPKTITSISLTAGDWDVRGVVSLIFPASTSFTALEGSISTTSNTLSSDSTTHRGAAYVPGAGQSVSYPVGTKRISISSTTTVYLVVNAIFTVSTLSAFGSISARRVR